MRTLFTFLLFTLSAFSFSAQIISTNKKKMVGVVDSLGKELIVTTSIKQIENGTLSRFRNGV